MRHSSCQPPMRSFQVLSCCSLSELTLRWSAGNFRNQATRNTADNRAYRLHPSLIRLCNVRCTLHLLTRRARGSFASLNYGRLKGGRSFLQTFRSKLPVLAANVVTFLRDFGL